MLPVKVVLLSPKFMVIELPFEFIVLFVSDSVPARVAKLPSLNEELNCAVVPIREVLLSAKSNVIVLESVLIVLFVTVVVPVSVSYTHLTLPTSDLV